MPIHVKQGTTRDVNERLRDESEVRPSRPPAAAANLGHGASCEPPVRLRRQTHPYSSMIKPGVMKNTMNAQMSSHEVSVAAWRCMNSFRDTHVLLWGGSTKPSSGPNSAAAAMLAVGERR